VQSVLTDARLTGSLVGAGKYAEGVGDTAFEPWMAALSAAVNIALETLYDPEPVWSRCGAPWALVWPCSARRGSKSRA
jgi:hypothetical protein